MDIRGIELRREVQQALLFRVRHVERGGGCGPGLADEEQVTPQRGQFAEEKAEIHATLQQFLRQRGNVNNRPSLRIAGHRLALSCVRRRKIDYLNKINFLYLESKINEVLEKNYYQPNL